jgi:hypothetical protein
VIGAASISTLAKDLRSRFMGADVARPDWELPDDFTVRGVADRLVEMMFDELYSPAVAAGGAPRSTLGFVVAGCNALTHDMELWEVTMDDPGVRPVPQLRAAANTLGWVAFAIREAAMRLFNGVDPNAIDELATVLDPTATAQAIAVLSKYDRQPVVGGMPFADAINFARFLTDTTIGYTHYILGPDVVGGPVEIAAISRHEGFRWVSRKHYYSPDLNPKDPGHVV